MSQTASSKIRPPPPFKSKADFLAHGMIDTTLNEPLDCPICRDPLVTSSSAAAHTPSSLPQAQVISFPRASIDNITDSSAVILQPQDHCAASHNTIGHATLEPPTQIAHCSHIFGRHCLQKWFGSSTSNRCPTCNQTLFPPRCIHLYFREPTRTMRLAFVKYIESALEDQETAAMMQKNLMGEWSMMLMREFTIELYKAQGFEVTWEYVDGYSDGEDEGDEESEEAEDNDEMIEIDGKEFGEEMDSGSESQKESEQSEH
ncbi:hypothetical protein FB567DRAFT_161494 [Paraphoma chrysanthemicola]|uniref:RING-type domain-containing protein n=1 Tax=Paraphoma chrysanthemicola TaxID=798071 RepID=A0A8K0RGU8_9PLEO|nr:hypothetical protein FB567DRAFT_161494 [Paraphoma chrysanthemicola]